MVRVEMVAICLGLALTYNFVECSGAATEAESNVAVSVVQNLTEFLEQNPNVRLLQEFEEEPSLAGKASVRMLINYKVGNRISGMKQESQPIS